MIQYLHLWIFWATLSGMVLVGNPIMATRKVADMMYSKAIGRITEANTMEVTRVVKGPFMVAKMTDHIAKIVTEIRTSIGTRIISMINANLLTNGLYLHLYRLWWLVSSEWQW